MTRAPKILLSLLGMLLTFDIVAIATGLGNIG